MPTGRMVRPLVGTAHPALWFLGHALVGCRADEQLRWWLSERNVKLKLGLVVIENRLEISFARSGQQSKRIDDLQRQSFRSPNPLHVFLEGLHGGRDRQLAGADPR